MLGKLFVIILSAVLVKCNYVSDSVIFPPLPNGAPKSENTECRQESQLYIENLQNLTLWAHKSKSFVLFKYIII